MKCESRDRADYFNGDSAHPIVPTPQCPSSLREGYGSACMIVSVPVSVSVCASVDKLGLFLSVSASSACLSFCTLLSVCFSVSYLGLSPVPLSACLCPSISPSVAYLGLSLPL